MQLEFFDVPSPCIGVCQSDDKGCCLGCMRTREERQSWVNLNSADRQKVIKRCQQRKKRRDNAGKIKVVVPEINVVQPSLLDPPLKPLESKKDVEQETEPKQALALKSPNGHEQEQIDDHIDFSDFEL